MSEYPTVWAPSYNSNTGQVGESKGEWTAPVIEELMYSTQGTTQKGVTLAPGQGVLLLGSIISARADGYYVKTGTAGAGPAEGLLRDSADTGTANTAPVVQGNIVIMGIVKNSVVQAAQATDGASLKAVVNENMDTFKF